MTFDEACKAAKEYDAELLAHDERFNNAVRITTDDGGSIFFNHAFLMSVGEWLVVFTEHNGYHCYKMNGLIEYGQYKKVMGIGEI